MDLQTRLRLFRGQLASRAGVSPSDIALAEADDERAPGWELVVGHGSPQELRSLVPDAELVGWANGDDRRAPLAIRRPAPAFEPAPPSFRVLAVVPAYDEVDILDHTIKHLVDNGVEVHVIDNWSTDGCFDIANGWLGNGVIKVDRFPDDGPADHFDWHEVLRRIPRIGAASGADWTLFNDADELRESPWPGVTLRDALWHVQCSGWNCVNLTLVNFALTNPETAAHGPSPDRSLTDSFPCLRPAPDADLTQLKLWRNTGEDVEIASTGGHTAKFTGRRVFPYNFLQRHYPYRSLEQAARKVQARERRRPKAERRMNWGWHYRTATLDSTLVPENGHIRFDDSFLENYLIERLSGIGWRTEIDPPTSLKHKVARGLDRVGLWKPYERARLWRRA